MRSGWGRSFFLCYPQCPLKLGQHESIFLLEVEMNERNERQKVYDEPMVRRICEQIDMKGSAQIPLSDIYMLLPLDIPPVDRAKRIANAYGFKIESDHHVIIFKARE